MSVAIRAITRLADADDVNVLLGVGVDEYALTWDNDTAKFVLRAPFAGLLATGATVGATAQAQAFTNGIIGPSWKPSADSTTALQMQNAAGTAILTVDTTDRRLRLNAIAANSSLAVQPYNINDSNIELRNYGGTAMAVIGTGSNHCGFVAQTGADFLFQTASSRGLIFKQSSGYIAFRDYQDYEAARVTDAEWAFNYNGNPSFDVRIRSATLSHLFFADGSADRIGIGTTAPATLLHVTSTTATTNALRNVLTLGANVTDTGVGAAGLGAAVLFQAKSTTTVDSDMAQIGALWTTATHATRASALTFSTLTAGGSLTERMRIDGAGNVGIGTSTPGPGLTIKAGGSMYSGIAMVESQYDATAWLEIVSGSPAHTGVRPAIVYPGGSELWITSSSKGNEYLTAANAAVFSIDGIGIGGTPASPIHLRKQGAAHNSVVNCLRIANNPNQPTGEGAGVSIQFDTETTTTKDTITALVYASWYEATHATRKADLVLNAYDTAIREGLRIRGNGSAPAIGFLGATPQARILHVADPAGGATVDAEARSAINSILSTLELFGFHAAS